MDILPAGGCDDGSRTAGSGDIRLPLTEHGHTVHCDQARYGPVSGGGMETGAKDIQSLVGTGWGGCEKDADSGSGDRTSGGRR